MKTKKIFITLISSIITIATVISLTPYARTIYAKEKRNHELNNLKNISSKQYNENKDNFTLVKEYDTTNNIRLTNKIENNYDTSNYDNYNDINKDNDVTLLAHLIESEAGCEPYYGKLAVASVVLNRMNIDNKSLKDVIFQKNQFDGIHTNNFKIDPSNDSIKAAQEALQGKIILKDAYYFADLNLCSPDFAKMSTFIIRIGDHWFFRK